MKKSMFSGCYVTEIGPYQGHVYQSQGQWEISVNGRVYKENSLLVGSDPHKAIQACKAHKKFNNSSKL